MTLQILFTCKVFHTNLATELSDEQVVRVYMSAKIVLGLIGF